MTKEQAKNLIGQIATSYMTDKGKLSDIEEAAWFDLIKSWDYKITVHAIKILIRSAPPCENYGKMPNSKTLENFYNQARKPQYQALPSCPCCDNTRFVMFQNVCYDCQCWLDSGRPPRSKNFSKEGFNICQNLNCMNPGFSEKITVVRGRGSFWKERLKNCKHHPEVREKKKPGKKSFNRRGRRGTQRKKEL